MIASLSTALAAYSTTIQVAPAAQPIVVTGQRIKSAETDLAACIARKCPPDEDIDATLRLAESQILAGEYRDARATLLRSLDRNKDEAKRYPIPVSDLYRSNGKVAAHLGYDDDYYQSTWAIYRTLKEGLPSETTRHYSALMEVAETIGRTRGHDQARIYYNSIAKQAREEGRPDLAAIAQLRSAVRHLPRGSGAQISEVRKVAELKGEGLEAPMLEAKLSLARIAFDNGDDRTAEAILADVSKLNIQRPILVYAKPYEIIISQYSPNILLQLQGPAKAYSTHHSDLNVEDEWIDVSFRVTPEGRVADLNVIRSQGDLAWTPPLLESVRSRRYTAGKENDPNSLRTERYTFTSKLEQGTASRLMKHSPIGRVEYFDLTPTGIRKPQ